MKKIVISLTIGLLLVSCSFAPKYVRPNIELPKAEITDNKSEPFTQWWKRYNDERLNKLIDYALKNNDNLLIAFEKINEASAAFNLAKANLYPNTYAAGSASRTKVSEEVSATGKSYTTNNFSISGGVSYEIDFFGKLKNQKKAQLALLLSQKSYADAVRIKLISDVATTYFELCAIDKQLQIENELIKRYEESYNYRQKQLKYGLINELTVQQEKANLDGSKLTLEVLKENRKLLENVLSLLLGKSPSEIFGSSYNVCEKMPEPISLPPFIPSDVVEKRPDIIQAEENLKAANFAIGVAKAAYFPNISLTGALGLQSTDLTNLFQPSANFWNIGGSITAPIFDFGRIKANVKIANSKQKQALLNYIFTVKNAFKEIHDAFIRLESIQKQIKIQKTQIENFKRILYIAEKQYKNGLIDYITVIEAKQHLEKTYINLVNLNKEYLKQQIFLYKALGGS
ncbi:efflux transporter outer membrane subunit [Deferribacter thermophilus]|uniref:efflux transporter outer membrane subunit n=1 Tax=Deferribacter thermophilus TaxID=53573 RepID=UPI003C182836